MHTITLYHWDVEGIYTHSTDIDAASPMPLRSTLTAPPQTSGTEAARWTSAGWEVLPERPAPPLPPAPPPVPIDELRAAALARITDAYETRAAALAAGYPGSERESWPVQIAEAAIVRAGGTEPTPWIDAAAPARGITREQLADLIHAQDQAYRAYHGALTGTRQALRDAIAAVPDDEHAAAALAAIQWPPDPDPEPEEP